GIVEGGFLPVDDEGAVDIGRCHLADCLRCLTLDVPQDRDRYVVRRIHVYLAGNKGKVARRHVSDDYPFDAVEIGPVRFPVIEVLGEPDHFVRLEFDEFERAGAHRTAAHVAWADMAGIDRCPAGGQQCQEGRLRPLQPKGNLEITVWRYLLDIAVPRFTRIDAQLLAGLAGEQVPGTFDVLRSERL